MRREFVPAARVFIVALAITFVAVAVKVAVLDALGTNAGFVIYVQRSRSRPGLAASWPASWSRP